MFTHLIFRGRFVVSFGSCDSDRNGEWFFHMLMSWPVVKRIIDAGQMRRYADISKARDKHKISEASLKAIIAGDKQRKLFLESDFLEPELEALERNVVTAAKQGKYEVEAMAFPAVYCTDGGRAINNAEKAWPDSLQGRARSFYEIWQVCGKPKGYRLKAQIRSYPGGFLGDASLVIDWSQL